MVLKPNVVARIDRDYIAEGDDVKRIGSEWTVESIRDSTGGVLDLTDAHKVRFRLLDDDGEVYYGGWLLDDVDCFVQDAVLEWGKYDSGCTTIEVKDDKPGSNWRRDIG
jgi:hypothetical protein